MRTFTFTKYIIKISVFRLMSTKLARAIVIYYIHEFCIGTSSIVSMTVFDRHMRLSWQNPLYEIVPRVKKRIIDSFTPEAFTIYDQEFQFFDKVTSISGALFPLAKESRRQAIRR